MQYIFYPIPRRFKKYLTFDRVSLQASYLRTPIKRYFHPYPQCVRTSAAPLVFMTLPRGPVYMDLHVALSWRPLCLPHQIKWLTELSIDVASCKLLVL